MCIELAYICDDSQPKPENGLENLFITTDVTMVNSSGEEHKIPVHSEKEETAKPIARVKEMVQNKLKDATDIKKRHEAFKPGQLTLPAMMLLLVPSVFYYGIAGAPVISAFGFLISFVYVLNYLLKLHLGVAVIRTSTNDMGQMATGSMVVRFPVYLDKISRYLNQKREESGIEITFTHIALKAIAAALDDSTNVHGHVMLGEFFRANTEGVDVSVTVDVANNETATIKVKDANLKGVDYLADELAKRSEQLKSGPSLTFSNKAKLLGLFPHMVRKYLDNMLNFIGSQLGIDIPFLGVVAYPLGCATLITSQLSGEQVDVGDVDTDMTMVSVMSTYSSAPIMVAIGGVRILTSINQENGAMSGVPVLTVSVTVDSKAGTLKEIRKYCSIVQQYMNAPAMLDKVDRKKAVEEENKRMLVERERKNANKYKTK